MPGAALQLWPNRIIAGAFVTDGGVVAASLGGVLACVRNGAGDYTLQLRDFSEVGGRPPLIIATAISDTSARIANGSAPDSTHVRVLVFDAAGVAADNNFCVMVFSTERLGVAT
jgi:hypothetical protein